MDIRTQFGKDIDCFRARHNMTKSVLAEMAGVNYMFMCNCCYKRTDRPGYKVKPAVYEFMKQYEDECGKDV